MVFKSEKTISKPHLPMRFFAFLILPFLVSCSDTNKPTVAALSGQLAGDHCRFDYPYERGCELRNDGFFQWLLREPLHCDEAAVKCLGLIHTSEAYDALIGVLTSKSDVETCDGVYGIRTSAVKQLGESGYKPAIAPLQTHLASSPVQTLSSGASGCTADPEPVDVIREALAKLQP